MNGIVVLLVAAAFLEVMMSASLVVELLLDLDAEVLRL